MKLLTNPSMVIIAQCITYNRLYTLTLSNVIYQSHLNKRRKNEENRLLYPYNYQANVLVLAGFSLDSLIAPSWLFFFFHVIANSHKQRILIRYIQKEALTVRGRLGGS